MAVEFLTGNPTIDAEHQELYAILKMARSICVDMLALRNCAGCDVARRDHCESHLLKLLGDLLFSIVEHFKVEESMMRESLLIMVDHLQCELHMEDHAAISSKIERIIAALDTLPTVDLLREVEKVLASWVMNHIATHDMTLVNWIEREDSALRSGF
ncbi:MAG: hemerythrin domain-containing protein [Azonexus sp.]